jgi:hypothetical protein
MNARRTTVAVWAELLLTVSAMSYQPGVKLVRTTERAAPAAIMLGAPSLLKSQP